MDEDYLPSFSHCPDYEDEEDYYTSKPYNLSILIVSQNALKLRKTISTISKELGYNTFKNEVELLIYVDEHDKELELYNNLFGSYKNIKIISEGANVEEVNTCYNVLAAESFSNWIMIAPEDCNFKRAWYTELEFLPKDDIAFVKTSGAIIISRTMYDIIDDISPIPEVERWLGTAAAYVSKYYRIVDELLMPKLHFENSLLVPPMEQHMELKAKLEQWVENNDRNR